MVYLSDAIFSPVDGNTIAFGNCYSALVCEVDVLMAGGGPFKETPGHLRTTLDFVTYDIKNLPRDYFTKDAEAIRKLVLQGDGTTDPAKRKAIYQKRDNLRRQWALSHDMLNYGSAQTAEEYADEIEDDIARQVRQDQLDSLTVIIDLALTELGLKDYNPRFPDLVRAMTRRSDLLIPSESEISELRGDVIKQIRKQGIYLQDHGNSPSQVMDAHSIGKEKELQGDALLAAYTEVSSKIFEQSKIEYPAMAAKAWEVRAAAEGTTTRASFQTYSEGNDIFFLSEVTVDDKTPMIAIVNSAGHEGFHGINTAQYAKYALDTGDNFGYINVMDGNLMTMTEGFADLFGILGVPMIQRAFGSKLAKRVADRYTGETLAMASLPFVTRKIIPDKCGIFDSPEEWQSNKGISQQEAYLMYRESNCDPGRAAARAGKLFNPNLDSPIRTHFLAYSLSNYCYAGKKVITDAVKKYDNGEFKMNHILTAICHPEHGPTNINTFGEVLKEVVESDK